MPSSTIDNAFTHHGFGSAGDPTFAGALSFMRRPYTKNVDGADVVVWGIPFDASVSNRPGTRFGPQAIRRASAILDNDPQYPFHADVFAALKVVDYGDCLLDYGRPMELPERVEREATALLAKDVLLASMGGDHFVTWPLLKAHAAKYGPLSLVQFDAHQDTWPDDGGRVDHGSFVLRAVREGIIDPETSIQVGIRTHAPEDCGIKIIHGYDVEEMSAQSLADAIISHVSGNNAYITFDIDCLDPAYAPGTGTPVAGGPSSAKMLSVLHKLGKLNIVGADCVEVSPAYDHADITAIAGAAVMQHYIGLMAEKNSGKI